ncbi:dockerin type I domain-containing protein [Candidatus Poribacteria bacterium]
MNRQRLYKKSMATIILVASLCYASTWTPGSAYADEAEYPAQDVNNDGTVDIFDILLVSRHLGEKIAEPLDPNPDVNGDDKVDILDLILVARNIGTKYFRIYAQDPLTGQGISDVSVELYTQNSGIPDAVLSTDGQGNILLPLASDGPYIISVKDEDSGNIGRYFNLEVPLDSIVPGKTFTFPMIPNLKIQNPILAEKYAGSFLEMLLFNYSKVPEAWDRDRIIGQPTTKHLWWEIPIRVDFGDYSDHIFGQFSPRGVLENGFPWSQTSVHFDQVLRELFSELNQKLGFNLTNEVVIDPTWAFLYEDRAIQVDHTLDPDGSPSSALINFRNYVLDFPNAYDELSKIVAAQLLMNQDFDPALLNLGDNDLYDYFTYPRGRFSSDFTNILKVIRWLPEEFDFSWCVNEGLRVPVAKIDVSGAMFTGSQITLDASSSTGRGSNIVGYEWSQVFMHNLDLEYKSSNPLTISEPNAPVTTISAEWPGYYVVECKVITEAGTENKTRIGLEILMSTPRQLDMGVMMRDVWLPIGFYNLETFPRTLNALQDNGSTVFSYVDIIYFTQSEPSPKIENKFPNQEHGQTIEPEDFLELSRKIRTAGLQIFIYKIQIGVWDASIHEDIHRPHSVEWWEIVFDQLEMLYIEKARMCKEAGVDKIILSEINLQAYPFSQNWPEKDYHELRWRDIIRKVKAESGAEVGIYQAIGGPWDKIPFGPVCFLPVIPYVDELDFVSVYMVAFLIHQDDATNDIPVDQIRIRALSAISSKLDEFHASFRKPIVLVNMIEHTDGAAKYIPHDMDYTGASVSYRDSADLFDGVIQAVVEKPYITTVLDNGYTWNDRFDHFFARRAVGMRAHPEEEIFKIWAEILK